MLRNLARRQLLLRSAAAPARGSVAHAVPSPRPAAPSSSRLPQHAAALHTTSPLMAKKASRSRKPQEEVEEVEEDLDDDLFGGVSSADDAGAGQSASPQASSDGFKITSEKPASEAFQEHVSTFRAALAQYSQEGKSGGQLPHWEPLRQATNLARSYDEFATLFEIRGEAKRTLGLSLHDGSVVRLGLKALMFGHGELLLDLVLRGEESELYDLKVLREIQTSLLRKVSFSGPKALAESAARPGAPQRAPEWAAQVQEALGEGKAAEASEAASTENAAAEDATAEQPAAEGEKPSDNFVERGMHKTILVDRILQCAALTPINGRHDYYLLAAALAATGAVVRRFKPERLLPLKDEVSELLRLLPPAMVDPDIVPLEQHAQHALRKCMPQVEAAVQHHAGLPQDAVQYVLRQLNQDAGRVQ